MMSGLQLTLYEILGYIFPGIFGLISIAILYWTVFWSNKVININLNLTIGQIVVLLISVYVTGHIIQAISNSINKYFKKPEEFILSISEKNSLSEEILKRLFLLINENFLVDANKISKTDIYFLCDSALLQNETIGQREIFEYREGFYRGMSITCFILSIVIVIRSIVPDFCVKLDEYVVNIDLLHGLFFSLVFIIFGYFNYIRFRRFARYRVTNAIFGYLALNSIKYKKEEDKC